MAITPLDGASRNESSPRARTATPPRRRCSFLRSPTCPGGSSATPKTGELVIARGDPASRWRSSSSATGAARLRAGRRGRHHRVGHRRPRPRLVGTGGDRAGRQPLPHVLGGVVLVAVVVGRRCAGLQECDNPGVSDDDAPEGARRVPHSAVGGLQRRRVRHRDPLLVLEISVPAAAGGRPARRRPGQWPSLPGLPGQLRHRRRLVAGAHCHHRVPGGRQRRRGAAQPAAPHGRLVHPFPTRLLAEYAGDGEPGRSRPRSTASRCCWLPCSYRFSGATSCGKGSCRPTPPTRRSRPPTARSSPRASPALWR